MVPSLVAVHVLLYSCHTLPVSIVAGSKRASTITELSRYANRTLLFGCVFGCIVDPALARNHAPNLYVLPLTTVITVSLDKRVADVAATYFTIFLPLWGLDAAIIVVGAGAVQLVKSRSNPPFKIRLPVILLSTSAIAAFRLAETAVVALAFAAISLPCCVTVCCSCVTADVFASMATASVMS